jgi:hypothetical protein
MLAAIITAIAGRRPNASKRRPCERIDGPVIETARLILRAAWNG